MVNGYPTERISCRPPVSGRNTARMKWQVRCTAAGDRMGQGGEEHEKETYENAEGGYDTRCGTDRSYFLGSMDVAVVFSCRIQFRFRVMEAV